MERNETLNTHACEYKFVVLVVVVAVVEVVVVVVYVRSSINSDGNVFVIINTYNISQDNKKLYECTKTRNQQERNKFIYIHF